MTDLNTLLDSTLDDLADLPSFKPFSAGAHRVLATFELKDTMPNAVFLNFTYLECLELANPQDEEPKEGDTANVMFMLDNEYGEGNFKKCAIPFAQALGFTSGREVISGVVDVECLITSSIRPDKKDPDKLYLQLKELQVV